MSYFVIACTMKGPAVYITVHRKQHYRLTIEYMKQAVLLWFADDGLQWKSNCNYTLKQENLGITVTTHSIHTVSVAYSWIIYYIARYVSTLREYILATLFRMVSGELVSRQLQSQTQNSLNQNYCLIVAIVYVAFTDTQRSSLRLLATSWRKSDFLLNLPTESLRGKKSQKNLQGAGPFLQGNYGKCDCWREPTDFLNSYRKSITRFFITTAPAWWRSKNCSGRPAITL